MKIGNGLWLNLGCSDDLMENFVNVDLQFTTEIYEYCDNKGIDLAVCNLAERWRWNDSEVDYILAKDIIEHLPNKIHTMNEMWRVLKPGGIANIEVPTTDGYGAFQDPTHVSYWNRNSFFYYEDRNAHRERFGEAYGVQARFAITKFKHEKLHDGVVKLNIILMAVK